MNRSIYIIAAFILLLLNSCTEEPTDQPVEKRKNIAVDFDIQMPEEVVTRATYDKFIFNITLLVFDENGILFSKKVAVNNGTPNANGLSLPIKDIAIEDNCHIYAIANIGHNTATNANYFNNFFQGIVEESDVLRIIRSSNLYSDIPVTTTTHQGLTMVGTIKITDVSALSGSITIPLQRIMAKIAGSITVKQTAIDAGVRLIGARIGNMADASYLFPRFDENNKNIDTPLESDEYSITDWISPVLTTTPPNTSLKLPDHLYVFENHKGEGRNKTDITSEAPLPPANATYLEILLDKSGTRYYYKIYIGGNNTTNYDIDRNAIYTLTVNINSVNNIDSDIRVTRLSEDSFWYVTDGLLLHYDGINNNGRGERVTNSTKDWMLDPPRPGAKGSVYDNTKFYYDYTTIPAGKYGGTNLGGITGTDYPGGTYVPIVTSSPDGMKNRWKNIAPATVGHFNLPIYSSTSTSTTPPSSWGPDCLALTGGSYASMEYDETNAPQLFPELFTIECVFLSSPLNVSSSGNDLFGLFLAPGIPYVIADVEVFQGGFGLIAGSAHNDMNYGTSDMVNKKRRLVLQFDGQKMIAWYGNKMVYTEPKRVPGALPWTKGKMGSPGPNSPIVSLRDDFATQLSLGTWCRHQMGDLFRGNIYAFRFYDRVLTQAELDRNYELDVKRFGISK